MFQKNQKGEKKARVVGISYNRNLERLPRKCYICGSEDHMIEKFPKPPKDSEKRRKSVHFNEKGNHACDNGEDDNDQNKYASMARMSSDDERESKEYGDSLQLTN